MATSEGLTWWELATTIGIPGVIASLGWLTRRINIIEKKVLENAKVGERIAEGLDTVETGQDDILQAVKQTVKSQTSTIRLLRYIYRKRVGELPPEELMES